jgi:hypothetical protein
VPAAGHHRRPFTQDHVEELPGEALDLLPQVLDGLVGLRPVPARAPRDTALGHEAGPLRTDPGDGVVHLFRQVAHGRGEEVQPGPFERLETALVVRDELRAHFRQNGEVWRLDVPHPHQDNQNDPIESLRGGVHRSQDRVSAGRAYSAAVREIKARGEGSVILMSGSQSLERYTLVKKHRRLRPFR